jgi:arabinose-5-phosphate isomerase
MKKIDILAEINRVIDIEIEALRSVRDHLDSRIEDAVKLIAGCRGQIVVTGIGKSGIIANKIAATLRSTGTQAIFLHASEALHGDIGMISRKDVVVAVGKSGESTELNDLLRFVKKSGARVISITSNSTSVMANLSDIVLDLKVPREACPLNLAPTASTTAALAVGDAIAVTLMKMNDIGPADFARHHPGGQLGRRLLLTVGEVMRKDQENPVISSDRPIEEMIVRMTSFLLGAISVINKKGHLLGLVTDFDIRKALASKRGISSMAISEIMNESPIVVFRDQMAVEALEIMRQRKKPITVLPVLDRKSGKVVGMVHLHNLLAAGL